MIREQSTNTLLRLVCHLLTVSRPGVCDSGTGWAGTVNKYRRGHACRNEKLILFDSIVYLSHCPFETSGPNHLTFEQSDICSVTCEEPSLYLWACSVSVDGNNIEHKTENYDKLRGLSSHNYGHTTLLLLYTPSHITLLHQAHDLDSFRSVACELHVCYYLHDCMSHHHTPGLYLGLDIMFRADNKTKSGIIQP